MSRSRWRVRTVRAKITAVATVAVAVALTVGSVALVEILERSLTHSGDALSQSRVDDISALAAEGTLPNTLTEVGDDSVAQVVTAGGEVLAGSPNISGEPAISSFRPAGDTPVVRTMSNVPDDDETEDFRVWAVHQQAQSGPVTIYVGASLESVTEAVSTLRRSLWVGIPALVALLGFATWVMVGRTLRPVEAIRAEVASISHQHLDRRVPSPPYDDEVGRLAATMNRMLDRLETASRSQREFVANASHELQSPLAALRAELEVSMAHPGQTDWPATARTLLANSDEMERLVRDLLFLAGEDRVGPASEELVDLDDVVLDEVARLNGRCASQIDTAGITGAPVRGSRDELARLVRNLLENAARHARSRVTVDLAADNEVLLSIWDDGEGVDPQDRNRIFERFYRADGARSRNGNGTGLGLAITRAIAERYAGSVELAESEAGARFVVRLPNA